MKRERAKTGLGGQPQPFKKKKFKPVQRKFANFSKTVIQTSI
jgi:ribosomal protein L44E